MAFQHRYGTHGVVGIHAQHVGGIFGPAPHREMAAVKQHRDQGGLDVHIRNRNEEAALGPGRDGGEADADGLPDLPLEFPVAACVFGEDRQCRDVVWITRQDVLGKAGFGLGTTGMVAIAREFRAIDWKRSGRLVVLRLS